LEIFGASNLGGYDDENDETSYTSQTRFEAAQGKNGSTSSSC
jgi:hypothetical protein